MTGVVNRVRIWESASPPTMATPSGWRSSAPTPVPSIKGSAPNSAAKVVIRIGRSRNRQARRMASSGESPSLRSACRAKSIIMIAFFFTMPMSSTMPMTPMTPRSMRAAIKASSAPTPAEGSVDKIVMG